MGWIFSPRIFSLEAMFLFQDRFSANAYAAEAAYQNLEDYRISLTRKYPAHASTIKKLLDEYQSWVITLEEKYGLPPILAMKNAKEAEFFDFVSRSRPVYENLRAYSQESGK